MVAGDNPVPFKDDAANFGVIPARSANPKLLCNVLLNRVLAIIVLRPQEKPVQAPLWRARTASRFRATTGPAARGVAPGPANCCAVAAGGIGVALGV